MTDIWDLVKSLHSIVTLGGGSKFSRNEENITATGVCNVFA